MTLSLINHLIELGRVSFEQPNIHWHEIDRHTIGLRQLVASNDAALLKVHEDLALIGSN